MSAPAIGRADLLRLLALSQRLDDASGFALMADCAGFAWRPSPDEPLPLPPTEPALPGGVAQPRTSPLDAPLPESPERPATGLTYYRVVARKPIPHERPAGQRPAWWHAASPIAEHLPAESDPLPQAPPLTPWRRLWPFLHAALGALREMREPDLGRILDLAARGQIPPRLPRRTRRHWAPRCRVILDFSYHLKPFHPDLRALIRPLLRLRGPLGLELLSTTAGADGPFLRLIDERRVLPVAHLPQSAAGQPVLILGDLGCYAGPGERAAWARLGRGLRRAGVRPVALMPCPARFRDSALAGLFLPVVWDRGRRLPLHIALPRYNRAEPVPLAEDPGADRLLDLLAPAIRLEPATLRALRCRLGGADLDAGAEAAAWLHPDLEQRIQGAEWRDRETVERRWQGHCRRPLAHRRLAGEVLKARHPYLARSVGAEESGTLARLMGEEDAAADAYLAATVRTLDEASGPLAERLRHYAGRLGEREPPAGWQDDRRAALWAMAERDSLLTETRELPPGFELARVEWVLSGAAQPRVWTLVQRGESLVPILDPPLASPLEPGPAPTDPLPGSPLAHLRLTGAPVQYAQGSDGERWHSVPPDRRARIPLDPSGLRLRGHDAELTIESLTRPEWAETIGQDGAGLYVEVREGEASRRLRWVPPGEPLSIEVAIEARGQAIPHGAFWDERAWLAWLHGEIARPAWASRSGSDEFGLWAEFEIKGVVQRMRWISPGEFVMGSPEDEPGRYEDERQHRVLLTRGLWLADTPCTQALWVAVMGENPSYFITPERPVEQVSWDDAQAFMGRLNAAIPGLDARLPSESEWEYACRAGTETALYSGPIEIRGDANAPALDPIAWYGGNSSQGFELDNGMDRSWLKDMQYPEGQAGTHPVGQKQPNDWGLYDMLGNVWEWCEDWRADYPQATALDPVNVTAAEVRVLRGGSWLNAAGFCRCARRDGWPPSERFDNLGFRLARGPSNGAAEPRSPGPAEPVLTQEGGAPGRSRAGQAPWSGAGQALLAAWRKLRG